MEVVELSQTTVFIARLLPYIFMGYFSLKIVLSMTGTIKLQKKAAIIQDIIPLLFVGYTFIISEKGQLDKYLEIYMFIILFMLVSDALNLKNSQQK